MRLSSHLPHRSLDSRIQGITLAFHLSSSFSFSFSFLIFRPPPRSPPRIFASSLSAPTCLAEAIVLRLRTRAKFVSQLNRLHQPPPVARDRGNANLGKSATLKQFVLAIMSRKLAAIRLNKMQTKLRPLPQDSNRTAKLER